MAKSPVSPSTDWYTQARYGLFVHYGLYSLLGRGEWVLNREHIPIPEYKQLASRFTASNFDADAIADLAVRSGMKYLCFTTMHHDGFRLYHTELSDFCTTKTACGRDLTAEIIAAARKRGLKVALYHSLNNWTDQPDAVDALESKTAYKKFLKGVFARVEELVTRYNPIDTLWYDGWWPFNADLWEGQKMNDMVRKIQPHILFNGRNGLPGDFATPEGHISAPKPWRPWEACMTLNNNWGFHAGDNDWRTPNQLIDMLVQVANGRGNLLVNIGPTGDGSIPQPSVQLLDTVGAWVARNGDAITNTDVFTFDLQTRGEHRSDWGGLGPFSAKGNNLYHFLRRYVPSPLVLWGVETKVKSVSFLGNQPKAPITFTQDGSKVTVHGLPEASPDPLCSVLKFECDKPPVLYNTGGMRTPKVAHCHYDPCPSDLPH